MTTVVVFDLPWILVLTMTRTGVDIIACFKFLREITFPSSISHRAPEQLIGGCINFFFQMRISFKRKLTNLTLRLFSGTASFNITLRIQRKCELHPGTNEATGVFHLDTQVGILFERTPLLESQNRRLLWTLGGIFRLQRSLPNYNRPWHWRLGLNYSTNPFFLTNHTSGRRRLIKGS